MRTLIVNIDNNNDYLLFLQLAKRFGINITGDEKKTFKPVTMSMFKGILSKTEALRLKEYVKKSRQEWGRNS